MNIPEYFPKYKNRELPKYIYPQGKTFFVKLCKSGKIIFKSRNFDTLEEAREVLNNYLKDQQDEKEKQHFNKTIIHNEDGKAIIKCNREKGDIIVDDKLWHILTKYSWSIDHHGYATGKVNKNVSIDDHGYASSGRVNNVVRMHRFIMELNGHDLEEITKNKCIIDHINNNRLDNRYENLRVNTNSGNNHNRTKNTNASSKYKGVSYFKRDKNWLVQLSKDHINYYCGYYKTEKEAALVFNVKAVELYGKDYANLNIF